MTSVAPAGLFYAILYYCYLIWFAFWVVVTLLLLFTIYLILSIFAICFLVSIVHLWLSIRMVVILLGHKSLTRSWMGRIFCYEKNLLGLILVLGGSLRWLRVANHLFLMPNLSRLLQKSGNVITLWWWPSFGIVPGISRMLIAIPILYRRMLIAIPILRRRTPPGLLRCMRIFLVFIWETVRWLIIIVSLRGWLMSWIGIIPLLILLRLLSIGDRNYMYASFSLGSHYTTASLQTVFDLRRWYPDPS